jgi:3-dehydroquinate synthase
MTDIKFIVDGNELSASTDDYTSITIKSHPCDYEVVFEKYPKVFGDNDVLLIDSNVSNIYNLTHSKMIVVEATEDNKSMDTVLMVCAKLLEYNFDKGSKLYVVGGGIIQDIGAFTSKIYKRGINWIFIPTTLLSQCDSCIGGKTALNYNNHKNQLALFSAPSKVIIDTTFLSTLSEQEIISGYGEIVKLFIIGGEYYIDILDKINIEKAIMHSLAIKKAVVEFDEFEHNVRKVLNYGHTFGHAIEALSNFSITHGKAVLYGIEIINRLFSKSDKITKLVERYVDLNVINTFNSIDLTRTIMTDKKVSNGVVSFVVTNPGVTTFVSKKIDNELIYLINEVTVN